MEKPEDLPYRKNAAVFVLNSEGLILACRRSDEFKSWQLPQGGIDEQEQPKEAALRELREEIGTSDVILLGSLPEPIRYEWPEHLHQRGYRGQEQYYFLAILNDESKIDLNSQPCPEFEHFEWMTAEDFIQRIEGFKSPAYKEALRQLMVKHPESFSVKKR